MDLVLKGQLMHRQVQNELKRKLRKTLFFNDEEKTCRIKLDELLQILERNNFPLLEPVAYQRQAIQKRFTDAKIDPTEQTIYYKEFLSNLLMTQEGKWFIRGTIKIQDENPSEQYPEERTEFAKSESRRLGQHSNRSQLTKSVQISKQFHNTKPQAKNQPFMMTSLDLAKQFESLTNKKPASSALDSQKFRTTIGDRGRNTQTQMRTTASLRKNKLNSDNLELLQTQQFEIPSESKQQQQQQQQRDGILNRIQSARVGSRPEKSLEKKLNGQAYPGKSTFSQFYLDDRVKDMISLASIENEDPNRNNAQVADLDNVIMLSVRETSTQAATLIDRIVQNETIQNQTTLSAKKSGCQSARSCSASAPSQTQRETNHLLQRVVAILKRYKIDPQRLNGVRFECQRQLQGQADKSMQLVPTFQFMQILKQYGLFMALEDQKDFFQFMTIGAAPRTFNLQMLAKVFQVIAKCTFKTETTSTEHTMLEPKQSNLENFISNLQSKLEIAFQSAEDMVQFMDLSGSQTIKIEEFVFGARFFCESVPLPEILYLYKRLDYKGTGQLDANQLMQLLPTNTTLQVNKDNNQILCEEQGANKIAKKNLSYRARVIAQSMNQQRQDVFKTVPTATEILDLPKFIKARKEKFELRLKGNELCHASQKSLSKKQSLAKDRSRQRKLVIVKSVGHDKAKQEDKLQYNLKQFQAISPREQNPLASSIQMERVVKNSFMNTFTVDQKENERVQFLDAQFEKRKPVFKSYMTNNTFILRQDLAKQKIAEKNRKDAEEDSQAMFMSDKSTSARQSMRAISERNEEYRQKKLGNIKPVETINKLLKMSTGVN